jgi:hypothetical protein
VYLFWPYIYFKYAVKILNPVRCKAYSPLANTVNTKPNTKKPYLKGPKKGGVKYAFFVPFSLVLIVVFAVTASRFQCLDPPCHGGIYLSHIRRPNAVFGQAKRAVRLL